MADGSNDVVVDTCPFAGVATGDCFGLESNFLVD